MGTWMSLTVESGPIMTTLWAPLENLRWLSSPKSWPPACLQVAALALHPSIQPMCDLYRRNVFLFLDVRPANVSSLLSGTAQVASLCLSKGGQVDKNHPFLVGSVVPAWLEEGCAFLWSLDAFTQETLFCTRPATINSAPPAPLVGR